MNTQEPRLVISETSEQSADACERFIVDFLHEALAKRSRATIAISGGHTPQMLFSKLAEAQIDWSKVHFFWVDERCVPPTDEQSNFKLANDTLLKPARITEHNIHRVRGEMLPEEAAIHYIKEIQRFFEIGDHDLPAFDIVHRGIGPDAHTASLFPGEPMIANRTGIAAAVWVEKLLSHRVTLLPGVLLRARRTVIQAEGQDKAEAVWNVLKGPDDPFKYPCQIAGRNAENTFWFLDRAAASRL